MIIDRRRRSLDKVLQVGLLMLGLACSLPVVHGQTVSTTETTDTERRSLNEAFVPLTATERSQANAWQLTAIEWRRYQALMQGIRGSVSPANLSPIEVLGIHARDAAERRRYAELWARAMRDDAERVLAFQRDYDAAIRHLLSGQALIDVTARSPAPQKNGYLRSTDRVLVFTRLQCPACEAVLATVLSRADDVSGIDVYITDPSANDADIRAWAEQLNIDRNWVKERRVTLNREADALAKLSGKSTMVPALFIRRDGELLALNYADLQ